MKNKSDEILSIELKIPNEAELKAVQNLKGDFIETFAHHVMTLIDTESVDNQFSMAIYSVCIGMEWLDDNNHTEALKRLCLGCLEDLCEATRVPTNTH